jgi:hypothetical protein
MEKITKEMIEEIEKRLSDASPAPWKSFLEGRDHVSGSDFIRVGEGATRKMDIEISGGKREDLDFIAHARQDVPLLIKEIKRLRAMVANSADAQMKNEESPEAAFSISYRLLRTTTENAFVNVPVTSSLMIKQEDGSKKLDVEKVSNQAIQFGKQFAQEWQPEDCKVEIHPIQTPPDNE